MSWLHINLVLLLKTCPRYNRRRTKNEVSIWWLENNYFEGTEVSTLFTLRILVFWDVTLRSLQCSIIRRFESNWCLHLQHVVCRELQKRHLKGVVGPRFLDVDSTNVALSSSKDSRSYVPRTTTPWIRRRYINSKRRNMSNYLPRRTKSSIIIPTFLNNTLDNAVNPS